MSNKNKDCDPYVVKKIIGVIIAILTAIAGAIGEASTNFVSNLLNF